MLLDEGVVAAGAAGAAEPLVAEPLLGLVVVAALLPVLDEEDGLLG